MIHLVTDTSACVPADLKKHWQIHTVPLKVTCGGQSVDEDKVPLDEFYRLLAQVETTPTTSQPTPAEFADLFTALTRDPGDEVLAIHISGGLSGTVGIAATVAEEVAPGRISVVDSRSTTCGLTMMVLAAARSIERGATRAEAADLATRMARAYAGVFLLQDLKYVAKGGRIGGAARLLGTLLHLQPVLYMNDGRVDALGVERTRKRGFQRVIAEVRKRVGSGPIYAGVTHTLCPEEAQALAEQVRREFECVDLFVNQSGPVLGSHSGPGFVGFTACPANL